MDIEIENKDPRSRRSHSGLGRTHKPGPDPCCTLVVCMMKGKLPTFLGHCFISEIEGLAKRGKGQPSLSFPRVITSANTPACHLREAASKQDLECGHLFLPVVADHHRRAPGVSAPVFRRICGQ